MIADPQPMPSKRRARALVVAGHAEAAGLLAGLLEQASLEVRTATGEARGEEVFRLWRPDVVIADFPDVASAFALLHKVRAIDGDTGVVIVVEEGTEEDARRAAESIDAAAFDVIERPVERERLIDGVEKLVDHLTLVDENEQLRQKLEDRYKLPNIVGKSRPMRELFDMVESVAVSEANILIQGENGTGKELIANAIHYHSERARGPFIKINCAALPRDLIESELFGYRKGAFTGASIDKEGLLEMADGGSVLLDEIAEMPPF